MKHNRELVGALSKFQPQPWDGKVYRHMFSGFPPDRENTSGARWNPAEIPAIYTSLSAATALAEAEYYIRLQPRRPTAKRILYEISIGLAAVLDLSNWTVLRELGLHRETFDSIDYSESQKLGGAVEWLQHDGLLVPSARAQGTNLVIFPNQRKSDHRFDVLSKQEIMNKQ